MRQMSGLDASFVNLETPRTPMHLTSLLIYEQPDGRPAVSYEQVLGRLASMLASVPTFRQRIARVPLNLGRPWWVDDEAFDLEFHVRHLALPANAGWRGLWTQTARLASRPLDLSRPPWEITMIDGLDDLPGLPPRCYGLIMKTHHSAIDGASGIELLNRLQSPSPDDDNEPAGDAAWTPQRAPSEHQLLLLGAMSTLSEPWAMAKVAWQATPAIGRVLSGVRHHDFAIPKTLGRAPRTRLGGNVTGQRLVAGVDIDLADIRTIRAAVPGATVNDVFLSLVGGALRAYLTEHDDLPAETLVAMAPISTRTDSSAGNQVSTMFVPLRTDVADPLQRLAAVRDGTAESKALTNAMGARLLTGMAEAAPSALTALGMRLAARVGASSQANRLFNTIVTNVPGPQVPTYFCGARLRAHYGFGPVQDGLALFHSLMSADGRVFLSMTADRTRVPDLEAYQAMVADTVAESLTAARR